MPQRGNAVSRSETHPESSSLQTLKLEAPCEGHDTVRVNYALNIPQQLHIWPMQGLDLGY